MTDNPLRAALDAALGRLSEDDLYYDYPLAQSGEPMDPDLFVRYESIRAALAASATDEGPQERFVHMKGAHRECSGCEPARPAAAPALDGMWRQEARNHRILLETIIRALEERSPEAAKSHIVRMARAAIEDIDGVLALPARPAAPALDELRRQHRPRPTGYPGEHSNDCTCGVNQWPCPVLEAALAASATDEGP